MARKYPSGAQKRKARAERERQAAMTSMRSWPQFRSQMQYDPNGPPVELPIYNAVPATQAAAINASVLQMENGSFFSAAYLADGMLRDDRIAATLGVRINGLLGADLEIEPGKLTAKGKTCAEDCEEALKTLAPLPQLAKLQRYALLMGVGVGQILDERTPDGTEYTFRVWNNRFLRYDWTIRRYCLVTENRGEIVLEPDDPEWLIWEPFGEHGWRDAALMRSLITPYLLRYWTRQWWARYQEVHGQPIRLGIVPPNRKPADEKLFVAQLKSMAHEAVIRLEQGAEGNRYDVKLLEAASNNWQGFRELVNHCDDSIAIAILGQRQSTTGQGGLGSQEKAGEDTLLRLIRGDALIAHALREQVLKPWAQANYGDADCAPILRWVIDPPEDTAAKAQELSTLGDALAKLAPFRVDVTEVIKQWGLPMLAEGREVILPVTHAEPDEDDDAEADDAQQPPKDDPGGSDPDAADEATE